MVRVKLPLHKGWVRLANKAELSMLEVFNELVREENEESQNIFV